MHALDEAKTMYEQVWKSFNDNVDKLGDLEWITNRMIEKFTPNSETLKKVGTMFAMAVVNWAIDGYKMCKTSKKM